MDFNDFSIKFLMIGGHFVYFLWKAEIPPFLFLYSLTNSKLRFKIDGKISILLDDFFDICSEFVVGIDLLLDESILFEVFVKYLPEVMFLYFATHYI